jgi:hypothetical protein
MDKTLLKTVLNAVALAVGVAIIIMQILGSRGIGTAITLLGVGLTALALAGLQK